jgi:plastocyanin
VKRAAAVLVVAGVLGACSLDAQRSGQRLTTVGNRFSPATIAGQPSRQITLLIRNDDHVIHNFSVAYVPIDVDIAAGTDKRVIFVAPPQAGPVEFFCKFHRDQGMVGTLEVRGLSAPSTSTTTTSVPPSTPTTPPPTGR